MPYPKSIAKTTKAAPPGPVYHPKGITATCLRSGCGRQYTTYNHPHHLYCSGPCCVRCTVPPSEWGPYLAIYHISMEEFTRWAK